MQGQRSAIGSLPDSLNFDFGSTPNNVGMDQQIRWNSLRDPPETRPSDYSIAPGGSEPFIANINQEGPCLSRWNIGDPVSTTNFPNPMNHEERIIQNGWSSSMSSSASGPSLRPEEPIAELPSVFSRNSANLNLNSNQFPTGPSFYRSSNSGPSMHDLDINARLSGYASGGADLMECSDPSKSGGMEPRMAPSSSGPSEPFASSSGSGGFLVEDDDGRPGSSMDGRRMSCKRKSLEGHSGQSSASGSCFSREGGGSIWQAVPPTYNVGGSSLNISSSSSETSIGVRLREAMDQRLALSMGGISSGNSIPLTNVGVGAGDNSATSYRERANMSTTHDSFPNHLFVPRVSGSHSSSVSTHQPTRLVPVHPPLNLMPQMQPDNTASQTVARFHGLRRNVQTVRWSGGASGSRAGAPSDPFTVVSERNGSSLHEERNARSVPINLSEPPLLYPSSEAMNPSQNPPSWGMNNGRNNAGLPRSLASSSRAGPSAGSRSSSGPNWGSHRHSSSQYSSRLSEYIRRSLLAAENSSHGSSVSTSLRPPSQEALNPGVGHPNLFSRPGLLLDRRGDGTATGVPLSLRALAGGGEGRTRLFAEIRNVLDMMRRGETLRAEDVMILDPSVIFGMADMQDQHRDMRLDVDNMSYEELLALEERIGNVCTGLSEETIMARMKQRKYVWLGKDNPLEQEPCCICQEEYCLGEDLGTLECGHDFHTKCIKQWLGQKNLCPICKTTGLTT